MDIDGVVGDPVSRRRFLAGSGVTLAAGSATLLTGCGSSKPSVPVPKTRAESDATDVEILNGVLDLELMSVAAYKTAAGKLRGKVLRTAKSFLEQEQAHADALTSAIKGSGGTPNQAKSSYGFPQLGSERDALQFAVKLENTAVAAYIDALPKLTKTELRGTASAIMTTEAEHISVLLASLGKPPVPRAFVTGETS